jgi:hypothetical protein
VVELSGVAESGKAGELGASVGFWVLGAEWVLVGVGRWQLAAGLESASINLRLTTRYVANGFAR